MDNKMHTVPVWNPNAINMLVDKKQARVLIQTYPSNPMWTQTHRPFDDSDSRRDSAADLWGASCAMEVQTRTEGGWFELKKTCNIHYGNPPVSVF